MFNHGYFILNKKFNFFLGEATRAQWTPPLRESFGYPIFLLQTILTGYILRKGKINLVCGVLHVFLTVAFCCFWQVFSIVIFLLILRFFYLKIFHFPILLLIWMDLNSEIEF